MCYNNFLAFFCILQFSYRSTKHAKIQTTFCLSPPRCHFFRTTRVCAVPWATGNSTPLVYVALFYVNIHASDPVSKAMVSLCHVCIEHKDGGFLDAVAPRFLYIYVVNWQRSITKCFLAHGVVICFALSLYIEWSFL